MVPMVMPRQANRTVKLVAAALLPACAMAAEDRRNDFAFELGAGAIDNLERAASGGESGIMTSAGALFMVQRSSRRFSANVSGDLSYIRYPGDTYEEELLGNAQAVLQGALVPERLEWVLDNTFGQAREDEDAAPTPENTENINYLLTGPEITLPLTYRWQLRASGRYGRLDYQSSPFDSTVRKASLGTLFQLSDGGGISLDFQGSWVEPDDETTGAPSYRSQAAVIGYHVQGVRTGFDLDVGVQRLRQPGYEDESAVFSFSLLRKVGDRSSLRLEAGREYRNNGDVLRIANPNNPSDGQVVSRTVEAFVLDRASVNFGRSGRVTHVNAYVEWHREGETASDLPGRERLYVGGSVSRQLGPIMQVNVGFWHSRNTYDGPTSDDHDELAANLALTYRLTPRIYAMLSGDFYQFRVPGAPQSVETRQAWLHIGMGEITVRRRGAAAVR